MALQALASAVFTLDNGATAVLRNNGGFNASTFARTAAGAYLVELDRDINGGGVGADGISVTATYDNTVAALTVTAFMGMSGSNPNVVLQFRDAATGVLTEVTGQCSVAVKGFVGVG